MTEAEINFDVDVLRTFIESMRHKSLAKAAELRGKSPSTVTLQIQRLEKQLAVKLFRRAGRGVLPTERAERLLPYAERVVFANDEGFRAVGSAPALEMIRLAVPADLAETWLPPLLSIFMAEHAEISVETQVLRNSEIIERIDKAEVDVALHWVKPGDTEFPSPVATFPIEWMAATSFSTDPLRSLPIVVLQSPCLFRDLGIQELAKAREPSRVAMATTGVTGLWSAVAAGLGVTCRVPLGAPEGVARYEDARLPNLGTISLALRTSRHSTSMAGDLERHLANGVKALTIT